MGVAASSALGDAVPPNPSERTRVRLRSIKVFGAKIVRRNDETICVTKAAERAESRASERVRPS